MVAFQCNKCGKTIRVDQQHVGRKGKCPKCNNIVIVPKIVGADPMIEEADFQKTSPRQNIPIVNFICGMCRNEMQAPETSRGELLECPECGCCVEIPKKEKVNLVQSTKNKEHERSLNNKTKDEFAQIPMSSTVEHHNPNMMKGRMHAGHKQLAPVDDDEGLIMSWIHNHWYRNISIVTWFITAINVYRGSFAGNWAAYGGCAAAIYGTIAWMMGADN